MRKRFINSGVIGLLLITLFSVPLFAGGGKSDTAGGAAGKAEIRLWQHLDAPNDPYFYNLIDKFNQTHPSINMTFELIPWGGAYDTYTTALVAGDAADVIFYPSPTWGSTFWDMGVLEPLDDYVKNWSYAKDIGETTWESSRTGPGGQIFGIPVVSLPAILWYRADWFKELNLKVPTTKEEFLDAAKKITQAKSGSYGFGMRGARGGAGQMLSFVLPSVGNQWFESDGKTSTFRRPEALAAAEWYINLFKTEKVTPPSAPTDGFAEIIDGFHSGLTGMVVHHIMSWPGHVESLGDEKVGIAFMPSAASNGARWGELGLHHYVLPKAGKNKQAAFVFSTWMAEPEQTAYFGHNIGSIPVIKGAEEYDSWFADNRFAKTSVEAVPYTYGAPFISTLGQFWEQVWPTRVQQALLGQITVQQMMAYWAECIEAGVKR
jgi:multiple sugar transport system substrate-binding protein